MFLAVSVGSDKSLKNNQKPETRKKRKHACLKHTNRTHNKNQNRDFGRLAVLSSGVRSVGQASLDKVEGSLIKQTGLK